MTPHSPTIRRKHLSSALRDLRKQAGMTIDQVARRLTWDPSKISRIESNAWKLPRIADIEALCEVYGVTDDAREALVALARGARQRGWWEQYKDVLGSALPGLEAGAAHIWIYQPTLVPGLLQTPAYMRAVFRAGLFDDDAAQRRGDARQARQQILHRDHPPTLWVILDESVLRKAVGGAEVMADQVRHLLQMGDLTHVTIQVLPDSAGAHALMGGPITLMQYPDSAQVIVYLETLAKGDLYLEAVEDVDPYQLRYGHVMASALSVEASREYLQGRLEAWKRGGS